MNMLAATSRGVSPSELKLAVDEGRGAIEAAVTRGGEGAGEAFTVGVRPEHLAPAERGLRVKVAASEVLGAETIVHATLESGERLVASLRGIHPFAEGAVMSFAVDRRFVHVFDEKGDALAPMRNWGEDYIGAAAGERQSALKQDVGLHIDS
jgi:ABC-type sugar transport system ATPase subunit